VLQRDIAVIRSFAIVCITGFLPLALFDSFSRGSASTNQQDNPYNNSSEMQKNKCCNWCAQAEDSVQHRWCLCKKMYLLQWNYQIFNLSIGEKDRKFIEKNIYFNDAPALQSFTQTLVAIQHYASKNSKQYAHCMLHDAPSPDSSCCFCVQALQ
jgi:hypothetical protein